MLEKHPLSSQAFIPLQKTNFIVVVAPISGNIPDINLIEAFHISPEEGINFKPKVWHFPLIATENSNYLTIDKKGYQKIILKFLIFKITIKYF